MKNQITASILFSFKGKNHSPSLELNLDQHMTQGGCIPDLCPLIARANNFDMYSYEYEMMQAEPISFSNPQGMVAEYVSENNLNIKDFEITWHKQYIMEQLKVIAAETMGVGELSQQPELMQALLKAYQLGKK